MHFLNISYKYCLHEIKFLTIAANMKLFTIHFNSIRQNISDVKINLIKFFFFLYIFFFKMQIFFSKKIKIYVINTRIYQV